MSDCPVVLEDLEEYKKRRDKEHEKLMKMTTKQLEEAIRKKVSRKKYKGYLANSLLQLRGWSGWKF